MVSFSLKKKDDGNKKKGFGAISLKKSDEKNIAQKKQPNTLFGAQEEDEDETKMHKIDTFDTNQGAYSKEEGPLIPKGPLVISNSGNSGWRTRTRGSFVPGEKTKGNGIEDKKLNYGMNYVNKKKKVEEKDTADPYLKGRDEIECYREDVKSRPDAPSLEEYKQVPIEEFGAAMLRGMGWTNEDNEDEKEGKDDRKLISLTRRGMFSGVGAKSSPDLADVKRGDRLYVPVKLVNKTTGNEGPYINRERERSPQRSTGSSSYRSR